MKFTFLIITLFYLCSTSNLSAQINIKMDQKIRNLIYARSKHKKVGFRLHLTFDSDKSIVDKKRIDFINSYPSISSYIIFRTPYFYLDVGDFRTKEQALLIQEELKQNFPLSSVVKEVINLPRID